MFWTRAHDGTVTVYAARSDASATRFGAPEAIDPPAGTDDSFALDGSAHGDGLDLIGTFGPAPDGGSAAIWRARIVPVPTVTAAPVTIAAGHTAMIKLRVSDAGRAVAGATVTLTGKAKTARTTQARIARRRGHPPRARTNRAGIARLRVGPFTHSTNLTLRVSRHGYAPIIVHDRVRVRRWRRAVTTPGRI